MRATLRCLLAAGLAGAVLSAVAHTLPISFLRLTPEADYLHLELIFNPFELTFLPELDDNKDRELSLAELEKHGAALSERVAAALRLTAGTAPLHAETAGMDPDVSGHHARLRAHYKVDARRLPLTVESDLIAVTSGAHVTQVTYINGSSNLMAQLDSLSRRVTFEPPVPAPGPEARPLPVRDRRMASLLWLGLAAAAVLAAGAGLHFCSQRRFQS